MGLTTWSVTLGCFVGVVSALRVDGDSECHGIGNDEDCNAYSSEDCLWKIDEDTCVSLEIKITELMIESQSRGGIRFVEILNRGDSVLLEDVVLDGIFTGVILNQSLEYGQYLVLHDGDDAFVRCEGCDCNMTRIEKCANAIYVKCCDDADTCNCQSAGKSVNNRKWEQSLTLNGTDKVLESLEFDPRSMPQINKGYGSFLRKPTEADNQNGHNWMQTCNTQGTPGSKPFALGNCTWICTDDDCKQNGAENAMCIYTNQNEADSCDCSADDGYYFEQRTCMQIPMADECEAVWTSDDTGVKHLHFSWVPPMIDRDANYSLEYHSTSGLKRVLTMTTSQDVYDHVDETALVLGNVRTLIGKHMSDAEDCVGGVSPTADEGTTTKESHSSSSNNHHFPVWASVLIALLLLTALVGAVLAYKFWWLKRMQTTSGGLYEPFSDSEVTT